MSCLGILFYLLVFYCKLHSIKDSSTRKPCSYFILFLFCLIVLLLLVFILVFFPTEHFKGDNIIITNIIYHVTLSIFVIILPKYYISQNPCLNLYVSVYHKQPPPILPWQLPENFDSDKVKLIYVQWNHEE